MRINKIAFQQHGDFRGQLVSLESNREIPFEIKRVYYAYDTIHEAVRGRHAHKTLEQILICIHGSFRLLLDDGESREQVFLDKPYEGVYIAHMIWREMYDFSDDAVLLVLASDLYNEDDYIRDYEVFLDIVKKGFYI